VGGTVESGAVDGGLTVVTVEPGDGRTGRVTVEVVGSRPDGGPTKPRPSASLPVGLGGPPPRARVVSGPDARDAVDPGPGVRGEVGPGFWALEEVPVTSVGPASSWPFVALASRRMTPAITTTATRPMVAIT
jgi:hypothetical protein